MLDVGTGSGYQAAVLAELAGEVHSIERIPELAETARASLAAAGYASPMLAAAAMSLSSVSVLLVALRLRRFDA